MFKKVKTTEHGELLFDGGNIFICKDAQKVFITRADTEGDEEEINIIETAYTSAVYKIVDEIYFNIFLNIAEKIKKI